MKTETIRNGYLCKYMNGGYWSVWHDGSLFAAWVTKSEVIELTQQRVK